MHACKVILVVLMLGLIGQTKPATTVPATTRATTKPLTPAEVKAMRDDLAEASRRGILLSELQPERAQGKIVELQKQVEDLQSQLKVVTAQADSDRNARQLANDKAGTVATPSAAKQDQQLAIEKKVFLPATEFNSLRKAPCQKSP